LAIAELKESIANHDRQLESLDCRVSVLELNLRPEAKQLKRPIATPTPVSPVSPSKSLKEVEFPLKGAKSIDGIISYLTRKHRRNVHDNRTVAITSKSVYSHGYMARNVADLTSDLYFCSKNEPGQWICWDFHKMRVRPTHYTIKADELKSWVVESSLDFVNWTEIDRKTDNQAFKNGLETASFGVSNSAESRFIRLTQTHKTHRGDDYLAILALGRNYNRDNYLLIGAFEFFGTLLE
jgi:hypothetical protein